MLQRQGAVEGAYPADLPRPRETVMPFVRLHQHP